MTSNPRPSNPGHRGEHLGLAHRHRRQDPGPPRSRRQHQLVTGARRSRGRSCAATRAAPPHRRPPRCSAVDVELTRQPDRHRDVVGRRLRIEPVQEPHPLLRQRQRHPLRAADPRPTPPGPYRHATPPPPQDVPPSAPRTTPAPATVASSAAPRRDDHLRRQQRVATQSEEIIIQADPLDPEHLGEHPRHRPARSGSSGHGTPPPRTPAPATPYDPTCPTRSTGTHRAPSPTRAPCTTAAPHRSPHATRSASIRRTRRRHDIGHQPVTQIIRAHQHDRLTHLLLRQQRGLDLTELDALTTELHLEIGATQVLQFTGTGAPVVQRTRSPVRYIRSPAGPNGFGHEPVRRQIRATVIPARQLHTRQIQLTRHTIRHRTQPRSRAHSTANSPPAHRSTHSPASAATSAAVIDTAASVGPYRFCTRADDTAANAAHRLAAATPHRSRTHPATTPTAPHAASRANTDNIDGTKSVSVTPLFGDHPAQIRRIAMTIRRRHHQARTHRATAAK